jgi:hypothetical protein
MTTRSEDPDDNKIGGNGDEAQYLNDYVPDFTVASARGGGLKTYCPFSIPQDIILELKLLSS